MRFEEPRQKSLSELLAVLKSAISRYWVISLSPALVLLGLVTLLSRQLPSYYTSQATLVIKPQRLTSKLVENPTRDEMHERLDALAQEILARPRLKSIVDQYNLYPGYSDSKTVDIRGREVALLKLRDSIGIEVSQSKTGAQSYQTFRLSFSHGDPHLAYEVSKRVSNLFIEESMTDSRGEIKGTEEFLEARLAEARKKLETTENQVQEFVRANFGKLPEHLGAAVARLENSQATLATNAQLITANMTRKQNLERELQDIQRYSAAAGSESRAGDPATSLDQLESALVLLQSRYSEQHPDVVATKKRIEALRGQVQSGGTVVASPRNLSGTLPIRRDLGEVQVAIASLETENVRLKNNIRQLQQDIEEMPIKEQELIKIKRDYANVKEGYDKLLGARDDASLQSSLISSQKAPQFAIVEPAELPVFAAGPKRTLIFLAGIALSIIVFFAVPFAIYLFSSSYKFTDDVEEELGIPVIGVIPPMLTPEAKSFRRRLGFGSLAASSLSFAAGAMIIFFTV